ncbi:MAG TPA: histidine kinase [Vulgatibacter sp.]|nr:histidine kinase [Vulgatibacter sp.]
MADPEGEDPRLEAWRRESFLARARSLVRVRLAALVVGVVVLLVPGWAAALGIEGRAFPLLLSGMALYAAACGVVLARARAEGSQRAARVVAGVALCLDAVVATWLIAATGGLRSPLLALQVALVGASVWLFPRPVAAAPALLVLPALAQIDRLLGTSAGRLYDLLAIAGQGTLDIALAYLVVEASRREAERHAQALALEHARGELAVARERARLAREMHDGVGAVLTGLSMEAELLEARARDGDTSRGALAVRRGAEEALFELRRGLEVMRGDFDLAESTRAFCEAAAKRSGVRIEFKDGGFPKDRLDPETSLSLFRVAQEAISNALKHGAPSLVSVELLPAPGLRVRDDGRGFDPSFDARGHYGLRGMRERARAFGASLSLQSSQGRGTALEVVFDPNTELR